MKPSSCQARFDSDIRNHVKKPFLVIAFSLLSFTICATAVSGRHSDQIPDQLFIGKKVPNKIPMPPPPRPDRDKLIVPPGENAFFPIRADAQAYVLNVDRTVNLTDALNRLYYEPKWRGEVWTPFDQVDTIERATRLMGTWPEYNSANIYRLFTPVNLFFEKYSGFGP